MRRLLLPTLMLLVFAACGGGTSGLTIVASTPGTVGPGPQRVILAMVDDQQNPVGGPDQPVTAVFTRGGSSYVEVPGEWIWTIEGQRGFYVAYVDFDQPGRYAVALQPETGEPTPETEFDVTEFASVPEIGQLPPESITKTSPPTPIEDLSTDTDPDPSFYEVTVADAMSAGAPSLIVFATPAFCQTAVCGPTLDIVKEVAAAHPDLRVVHVEIYDNLDATAAGELQLVPAVQEWNLPSEPWVYVLDSAGRVAGRFEGAVSPTEIEDVLDFVLS